MIFPRVDPCELSARNMARKTSVNTVNEKKNLRFHIRDLDC